MAAADFDLDGSNLNLKFYNFFAKVFYAVFRIFIPVIFAWSIVFNWRGVSFMIALNFDPDSSNLRKFFAVHLLKFSVLFLEFGPGFLITLRQIITTQLCIKHTYSNN